MIGSFSGIDQNTIDQLMQAERIPLKRLTNKKTDIAAKQNAWKDINTRLNSLFEKMNALKNTSIFDSKVATSSDDKFVSVSAGASAADGKYNINVEQLATNSSVVGGKIPTDSFDGEGKILKDGTLKFENDEGTKFEVSIKKGDSLKDIVENINSFTKDEIDPETKKPIEGSGSGISASIVDGRLVLTNDKLGEKNISFIGDGKGTLDSLGLNKGARTEIKGKQAIFSINDIEIKRDTNTISDAIEGITINLNKVHKDGESDTINVSPDTEKATKAIQDFVDQYNSTMKFIEEKTVAGDPEKPGSRGVLAGENSLMRLQSQLRTLVTDGLNVEGSSIKDASQMGISTEDKFGALKFDKSKFLEALEKDKDAVTNFFNPGKDVDGKEQVGLIDRVNTYIDSFISKKDGIIKSQNESFEKSLKDLTKRIEDFETRMVKKEQYYVKKFTALDIAMMKAESQMQWLQGQVDAMNGGGRR